MKIRKALFPGSFDILTKGHIWVIEKAAALFDYVTVGITYNPSKQNSFLTIEERVSLMKVVVKKYPNVDVQHFTGIYTVIFAQSIGAEYIVKGVRNGHDFDYENLMTQVNRSINPSVDTILVSAPHAIADVSSSLVKSLIGPEGWEQLIKKYVPDEIADFLVNKKGKSV